MLVDEAGQVIDVQLRGADKLGLSASTRPPLEAAKKARHFPASRDDVAGKMWTDLDFVFEEKGAG